MKIVKVLFVGLGLMLFAIACNSDGNHQSTGQEVALEDTTLVKMDIPVSKDVAVKMDSFLQVYYQLKDAMVDADSIAARKISGIMLNKANMIPLKRITDSLRRTQAQKEISGLLVELTRLQHSETLEAMRSNFELISGATYRLIKNVGLKDVTVYRTFCPMAHNDQGAYWLSSSSAIRNPYFGHKMMTCGLVKETLQF